MKVVFPVGPATWVLLSLLLFTGCTNSETRIRGYFGMTKNRPLQDATIQAALQSQFPTGTPIKNVESILAQRGLGKDGKSIMWENADSLFCQPDDYHDQVFSITKRRLTVCFEMDAQQKVKQITVDSINIGL
jgi:hypothetical protein